MSGLHTPAKLEPNRAPSARATIAFRQRVTSEFLPRRLLPDTAIPLAPRAVAGATMSGGPAVHRCSEAARDRFLPSTAVCGSSRFARRHHGLWLECPAPGRG